MKRIYSLLLVILGLLFIQACKKKELPEVENEDPIFSVKSTINGSSVDVAAGKDNYYMYTSYHLDGLGIEVLKGTLKSQACDHCSHSFSISYRDIQYRNNLLITTISDVLKAGTYQFYNGTDSAAAPLMQGSIFNFTAYAPPGSNYTYSWNFGDGGTSNLANPSHQYAEPADYNVCLTVNDGINAAKTICNVITMDTNCRFQFNQTMSQNYVSFYTQGGAGSYVWDFGDLTSSVVSGSTSSHTYSQPGVYRISMQDTLSSLSCTNVFQKDIIVGNYNGSELAAGFNYTYNAVPPVSPAPVDSGFNKVIVTYTSPQGVEYSTYNPYIAHQQNYNTFVVTKAEPYQNNSAGQKTYKMEGSFKAWLYNVNNAKDSVFVETSKFVMGVAYP